MDRVLLPLLLLLLLLLPSLLLLLSTTTLASSAAAEVLKPVRRGMSGGFLLAANILRENKLGLLKIKLGMAVKFFLR